MLYAGLQTTLIFWRPTGGSALILYTMAALWGISHAILKTQATG